MESIHINEALMLAVEDFDVTKVEELLVQGADVNYCRPKEMYEIYSSGYENQPYTALRMVVFRISDSLLEDNDLRKYAEIAQILIESGADTTLAIQLAESRYGKYEPIKDENPFWNVYRIIAEANLKK